MGSKKILGLVRNTQQYFLPSQLQWVSQHRKQQPPESEPTTVDAPMKGNTIIPLQTNSATTPVTAIAAGDSATRNLPPPAVLALQVKGWKPATSRWASMFFLTKVIFELSFF